MDSSSISASFVTLSVFYFGHILVSLGVASRDASKPFVSKPVYVQGAALLGLLVGVAAWIDFRLQLATDNTLR